MRSYSRHLIRALTVLLLPGLSACASTTTPRESVASFVACYPAELPDPSTGTTTAEATIYGEHTTPPQVINQREVERALVRFLPPVLPVLRDRGAAAVAIVWLRIPETGIPDRVCIAESSGEPAIDEAGSNVARTMRFSPAELNGVPVTVWTTMPVRFQLGR